MKVWVLLIEHEHGINTYLGHTRHDVEQQLLDYVRKW